MSAFVRTTASVLEAGEPWAEEETLADFRSDEGDTILFVHRSAGFDPQGATFTRWLPEQWGVRIGADHARWYDIKTDALDNFNRAKAQLT